MSEPLVELEYHEYENGALTAVRRPVIAETPWVLYVDGAEILTFMCSPTQLHCLALGFLLSEGFIGGLEDVHKIKVYVDDHHVWMFYPDAGLNELLTIAACDEAGGSIDVRLCHPQTGPRAPIQTGRRILTAGCGGGITFDDLRGTQPPLASAIAVEAEQILGLMRDLNYQASLYRQARGVHTSALAEGDQLLVQAEDVGRHNTLDKIRGQCLISGISTRDRLLLTSGRISTEMISKARKMEVPVVVSRTSPTAASVRLAQEWGITLIGYARAPKLRVYSGLERVRWALS